MALTFQDSLYIKLNPFTSEPKENIHLKKYLHIILINYCHFSTTIVLKIKYKHISVKCSLNVSVASCEKNDKTLYIKSEVMRYSNCQNL